MYQTKKNKSGMVVVLPHEWEHQCLVLIDGLWHFDGAGEEGGFRFSN